ncbi:glutathione transferase GST 23-like [Phoenix dactylifera]|uniref:glutathione transferase n=1 Tax=Phoenix dactylifera TaxID=42345 RepID=A0A8B7CUJ7_PHODC|nr:glutathione transferase GST 23-like [Phoenix dactylifera]
MGEEGVKLYGNILSPFVLRVEWALQLKGIKYEYVNEDLLNKSPQLLQYNPVHKMVPVLVHNGKPTAESVVIVEYIDEAWSDLYPLLPSNPYQKANTRFWAKFVEEKCLHGSFDVFSKVGEEQLRAVKEMQESLKTLEGHLEGKKFFGGETIGFVDIIAGWMATLLGIIEEIIGIKIINEQDLPLISAWIKHFLDHNLVKETMPPQEKVMAHMRAIRENVLSTMSA